MFRRLFSLLIITRELWSVENGLLPPTVKVKRNELAQRYGMHFESGKGSKECGLFGNKNAGYALVGGNYE
ncbi:MAG: hypothetical protein H6573_20295 [Lewinellaceae bacterium]|nr:hypothetical protein [Phaeodactylibacter sp.]MCB9349827.1 hypothetical protein [Lewinellaceae bacterium]